MSTAPLPHTSPSTSSPPNGSRDQPLSLTGTTSVWPIRHRLGAVGSLPSMRATSEARPGVGSKSCESSPVEPRNDRSRSALRLSNPDSAVPSLTQRLRIICCSSSTVSPVNTSAGRTPVMPSPRSGASGLRLPSPHSDGRSSRSMRR